MHFYEMNGFMGSQTDNVALCGQKDMPEADGACLFLDFDGTLVDIVSTPDAVEVRDDVHDLLDRAMTRLNGRVAIVSGRSVEALEGFLPRFKGPIVGTHGAEIRHADGRLTRISADAEKVAALTRIVVDFGKLRPEFLVETKPTGVVLHFRNAPEHAALAMKLMEAVAHAADGFTLQPALMAYEIKIENTGKDKAMQKIMATKTFSGTVPVYAGDDLTDEPALELAEAEGGLGIKIGKAETLASHRLADPSELRACVERWLA
ncbi:trehalose-phosphatase [Jannaschia pohangensis]|uniref:Trehalose 6-phosphate phosphatase n=1 Tax=Jannaschia pohangensis TaxID=390807 RepID=A0A1I3JX51_9RHOB|nr:trehalose-phosphatase [Jannaschia pohangensis]SFI64736.1 trehalose 6-phosphatase [Jannaschia pohangensis]